MTCIGPRRGSLAAELAGWAPAPGRPPQLRRVTMNCVSIRVRGAGVPRELEEVPMPIVGGLDIHRKQITFDYLDTVTGEVRRGQITPADRAHLRAWLARFAGRDDVAFAMEGCTGWRYVAGEPAAAASGTPRPTRPIRGTCASCWPMAGCPSAGSRQRRSWNAGRCWRPTTICAASTPPGSTASGHWPPCR